MSTITELAAQDASIITPSLQEKVCSAIALARNFDQASISPDDNVHDLGLDSMSIVALLAELEAAYGVEFGADRIIEMLQANTVRDLTAVVGQVVGSSAV
jgi:acyl carrier protein